MAGRGVLLGGKEGYGRFTFSVLPDVTMRFALAIYQFLAGTPVRQELEASCPICGASFATKRHLAGHRAGKHREHAGVKACSISVYGLTDAQKGYIAAFLDGEGGIQITKSLRRDREYKLALHPDVYFTNTNQEVILTIRRWLGGAAR